MNLMGCKLPLSGTDETVRMEENSGRH